MNDADSSCCPNIYRVFTMCGSHDTRVHCTTTLKVVASTPLYRREHRGADVIVGALAHTAGAGESQNLNVGLPDAGVLAFNLLLCCMCKESYCSICGIDL